MINTCETCGQKTTQINFVIKNGDYEYQIKPIEINSAEPLTEEEMAREVAQCYEDNLNGSIDDAVKEYLRDGHITLDDDDWIIDIE